MPKDSLEIWSATPTPFDEDLAIDRPSVERLVEHHYRLRVAGLMLGGTCGEGPWMTLDDLGELVETASGASNGRLRIAAQVTDNSVRRVLERCETVAEAGAEIAVVSAPFFLLNATEARVVEFFREVIRQSPIPAGLYDRGAAAGYPLNDAMLEELLQEPNLVMVKDSALFSPERAALVSRAQERGTNVKFFYGNEFTCVPPLCSGYDGLLLGGAIFNAVIARDLMAAVAGGDVAEAEARQARMTELMYRVYGGEKITCWLTGLKYLLVKMGVFSTTQGYLGYPLTDECRAAIDEIVSGPDEAGFYPEIFASERPVLSARG
jgi:dihydrodipicolinate synthase/N-acetylneuraminate lyase